MNNIWKPARSRNTIVGMLLIALGSLAALVLHAPNASADPFSPAELDYIQTLANLGVDAPGGNDQQMVPTGWMICAHIYSGIPLGTIMDNVSESNNVNRVDATNIVETAFHVLCPGDPAHA